MFGHKPPDWPAVEAWLQQPGSLDFRRRATYGARDLRLSSISAALRVGRIPCNKQNASRLGALTREAILRDGLGGTTYSALS